jgi:hypothetical protein
MENFLKASNKGEINKTMFCWFEHYRIPIIKAGINSANVSFKG